MMIEFEYVVVDQAGQYHLFVVERGALRSVVHDIKTRAVLLDATQVRVEMAGFGAVVYDALSQNSGNLEVVGVRV